MNNIFSDRISDVPKSFIREILKVTVDPSVISFAGGLPGRKFFPLDELKAAAVRVFEEEGRDALQYNTSRLNFSCMDEESIREGIRRLGTVLKDLNR